MALRTVQDMARTRWTNAASPLPAKPHKTPPAPADQARFAALRFRMSDGTSIEDLRSRTSMSEVELGRAQTSTSEIDESEHSDVDLNCPTPTSSDEVDRKCSVY